MADFEDMLETTKKAGGALRDANVPYVLGGGLAAWARGGPGSDHDVDFLVKPEDVERGLEALAAVGMRPERPPEGWLVKAFDGDVMIDLIFEPATGPVTDEMIERAEELEVLSMDMRVLALEDVMVTKLLALDEQDLDLKSVLEIARPLREQIDWDEVRARTKQSPYAKAFFALVEELGIVERPAAG